MPTTTKLFWNEHFVSIWCNLWLTIVATDFDCSLFQTVAHAGFDMTGDNYDTSANNQYTFIFFIISAKHFMFSKDYRPLSVFFATYIMFKYIMWNFMVLCTIHICPNVIRGKRKRSYSDLRNHWWLHCGTIFELSRSWLFRKTARKRPWSICDRNSLLSSPGRPHISWRTWHIWHLIQKTAPKLLFYYSVH